MYLYFLAMVDRVMRPAKVYHGRIDTSRLNAIKLTPELAEAARVLFNREESDPSTESASRRLEALAMLQEAADQVERELLEHQREHPLEKPTPKRSHLEKT